MLVEMSSCPFCKNGQNTPCFAKYTDGYKCFTCGAYKSADRSFVHVEQSIGGVKLPVGSKNLSTFTYEAQKWLHQYYIRQDVVNRYNITQLDDGRLIFPIIRDNEVLFYIERQINPKVVKHHGKKQPFAIRESRTENTIIIVEDWVSAIRVSEQYNTLCLFGLFCKYEKIKELVKNYDNIVIWLDGDKPGQEAADKIAGMVKAAIYGYEKYRCFDICNKVCYNLCTKRDPKAYSESDINEKITKLFL